VNIDQVMTVLAEVRNLDARIGIRDLSEAQAKAQTWHLYLRHIDVEDALHAVRNYYRTHRDEVIQVGDIQQGAVGVHRDGMLGSGPRSALGKACPWSRHCTCTHDGCTNGWLDELLPAITVGGSASTEAAVRCPTCESAREMAEELAGSRKGKGRGRSW
jgi:hypothetical protein